MSARPIASGTISFGLVSIPMKLYAASDAKAAISFNLLHGKDGSRLKQQYTCIKDGEIVPRDQMVKGYEFSKDRYVTFTPEELKALEEQSTQSIEVVEFVPISKVDPVYFDRTYYVGPDKGGAKAYALLAKVMQETKRVALARYAARGKQYLVLLRPVDNGIVMQQLYYADEVRPFSEVPLEPTEVSAKELELAKLLVDQRATEKFEPETYEDDVKKRVLGLIQKKVEGEEVSFAPPEQGGGQIIDLMEALKASLGKKPGAGKAAEPKASSKSSSSSSSSEGTPARKPAKRAPARAAQMRTEAGRKA
jgi:DNA end-binding protein Ku